MSEGEKLGLILVAMLEIWLLWVFRAPLSRPKKQKTPAPKPKFDPTAERPPIPAALVPKEEKPAELPVAIVRNKRK